MTPALQQRVYEAHPELAFQALAGHPIQDRKKTVAGREERLRVLDDVQARCSMGYAPLSSVSCARTNVPTWPLTTSWTRMSWCGQRYVSGMRKPTVSRMSPHCDAAGATPGDMVLARASECVRTPLLTAPLPRRYEQSLSSCLAV